MHAWRDYVGARRGRALTLEEAAELIAVEAERQGFDRNARGLPCKHASLSRWEGGKAQQKIEGLGIIARAYGISFDDLICREPPRDATPEVATAITNHAKVTARVAAGGVARPNVNDDHREGGGRILIHDGKGLMWARKTLGWSHLEMALALRMEGPDEKLKARIHEMEIGKRDVSGPMTVAIEAFLAGFRPHGFKIVVDARA